MTAESFLSEIKNVADDIVNMSREKSQAVNKETTPVYNFVKEGSE